MTRAIPLRAPLALLVLAGGCLEPGASPFGARDEEAPLLVASVPFEGALRVPPDAELYLSFSEPLAEGQPTPGQVQLRSGELVVPVSIDHPRPGLVRLLPGEPLHRGLRYNLGLANSLHDPAFNPLDPASPRNLGFTVATADDPLQVVATEPGEGAQGVARRLEITLDFDVPLSTLTLDRAHFVLEDEAGSSVGLRAALDDAEPRRVILTPFAELPADTLLTLTVTPGLRDVQSRHLAVAFVLTFRTAP
ncbi:MAG: Ig-like domain-containing protein [Deltaproteobacteria bacterium]|nr:Ig-like domain-containing protein [Deltaproteobacteria bacterium]